MKKDAVASIWVEVNVDCPHCGHYFDLADDSIDHGVEKSDIMIAAFQDNWGCSNAEIEVKCPKCENDFIVNEIEW